MGARCRHYKALMHKNLLGWLRTPCGTICELLLPLLLMSLVPWIQEGAEKKTIDNYTLYSLRHPLYPVGRLDKETGNYTVDVTDQP